MNRDERIATTFGLVLREQRIHRGYSQERLDRTFISLLERGLRQPTLSSLYAVARVLDILLLTCCKCWSNDYARMTD